MRRKTSVIADLGPCQAHLQFVLDALEANSLDDVDENIRQVLGRLGWDYLRQKMMLLVGSYIVELYIQLTFSGGLGFARFICDVVNVVIANHFTKVVSSSSLQQRQRLKDK